MVKTQKMAVDVHALLESLGLCKLIGYDDSRRISSNFCFYFFTHCFYVIQFDFFYLIIILDYICLTLV